MKRHIRFLVVAIVAITGSAYAQQYSPDALRFSQTNFGSTARFKAMGNAHTGVGGDMSSLGGNPAGLGLFTKSEFSLTPEFDNASTRADYLLQQTNSTKSNININHIGIVLYAPSYRLKGQQDAKKGLVSTVWGIGYNRNNDFTARYDYAGKNPTNSIADYFAELGTSTKGDPSTLGSGTLERMAYDGYLIGYDAPGNFYFPETDVNNIQKKSEIRTGATSELNFSGAANISNQFYLGASIGLVNVRYNNDAEFTESGFNVTENSNYSLSFLQNQRTTGSGINAKIGVIFRPLSSFRIGATFQSPSWMLIHDEYSEVLNTKIASGSAAGNYSNAPANYNFSYRLRTPIKGSLGASYIIGGQALISADVDYIDYSSILFSTDQGNDPTTISNNNTAIRNSYKEAVNYRVGAEYKIDKFSIRAGYGVNGSPYKNDTNYHFDTQYYSGGLGYRVDQYYFDIAYQRVENKNEFSPYTLNDFSEPIAKVNTNKNNVFLTFGVRF